MSSSPLQTLISQGSDHCPVYATMKDTIILDGKEIYVKDVMNPEGVFCDGKRIREHSVKDVLPLSGKLIPEFDRRQNIRDMFTRKPTLSKEPSTIPEIFSVENQQKVVSSQPIAGTDSPTNSFSSGTTLSPTKTTIIIPSPKAVSSSKSILSASTPSTVTKRSLPEKSTNRPLKRAKSGSTASPAVTSNKGQRSLKGFFKPKAASNIDNVNAQGTATTEVPDPQATLLPAAEITEKPVLSPVCDQSPKMHALPELCTPPWDKSSGSTVCKSTEPSPGVSQRRGVAEQEDVHDPIESKESWSKLFSKPIAPRCEGHGEPCIALITKKSGMNCGRSFWMCSRPLGPTGAKEKNTQWRCQTFIWCSDWNAGDA